jgi:HPt (histidine-containing phosphotransfer) domain-containing protein
MLPETQRQAFDECDEDIARLYLKTASAQLKKMGAAARTKSMADVQRRAHKLSGASAFLGLTEMAKLLCELEQAASRDHSKEARRFIGLLKEEFGHVQRQCGLRFP